MHAKGVQRTAAFRGQVANTRGTRRVANSVKDRVGASVGRVCRSANCNVPMAVASFLWRPRILEIEINSIVVQVHMESIGNPRDATFYSLSLRGRGDILGTIDDRHQFV